jgi:FAD:protein FMN transferase
MGGPCQFQLDADNENTALAALQDAEAEVKRLESKYSRYRGDSLLSQINDSAGSGQAVAIDEETRTLLEYADTMWQQSEGLFDISSGVLRQAWDFRSDTLPQQQSIDEQLEKVGWQHASLSTAGITLPLEKMELDLGGLVKEYACDSAATVLRASGCKNGLVDLAGDIVVLGPPINSSSWPIGIRHPQQLNQPLAEISLAYGALATSGNYERGMTIDGIRYSHILNAKTGWPVSGLASVSIQAEQCLVAGSLATLAMLKPASEALEWLNTLGLPWLAVDQDMNISGAFNDQ